MAAIPGLSEWLRDRLGQDWGARAEFARRSGLHPSTVTKLVSGAYSGSRHDTQVKIAQGLGLTHAQLVAQVTGAASTTPRPALTPEQAIEADPNLTKSQKEALLVHVRSYRRGAR